jgi:uncharacterized protein (DUF305 family)
MYRRIDSGVVMRRPLLALAAVLAVLVAIAAAVATLSVGGQRGDGPGYGMNGMMSRSQGAQPGCGHGANARMNGCAAGSEFAFLAGMVAHHQEAVKAAKELQRSSRPQMREFGASIVQTQSAQIDQMSGWLGQWYPGRPTRVDYQPMLRDLAGLSGDDLDETFLQDMISHHMMAVMLSQQLLARGAADHGAVSDLAATIRDEQHAEISQMQQWLLAWFDCGWRCPGRGMGQGMM